MADPMSADRWFLSDCEGRLEIWREAVLQHVTRDKNGEITGYRTPGHYRSVDLIAQWDLNCWDPGEDLDDNDRRAVAQAMVRDHNERADLLAEADQLRAELADYRRQLDQAMQDEAQITHEWDQARAAIERMGRVLGGESRG